MNDSHKATRINLFSYSTPPMRAFHMSWLAFFLCFFAWFGIAPLMTIVRDEMDLTREQIGWCIIGSVSVTVLARLLIGWLCDRIGPRLAYTWLLVLGSLPVMGIALAQSFETFLLFRVLIGAIGASFVITQYHTSVMFAPNCVGTANATTAGWGNLGGGVTQFVMPLIFAFFVGSFGLSESMGWRAAMVAVGVLCLLMGIAYYRLTEDGPDGERTIGQSDNRTREQAETARRKNVIGENPPVSLSESSLASACRDPRVWVLAVIYGACFGIELTINNVAALYFADSFDVFRTMETVEAVKLAGLVAGVFGSMNLFARTLGGLFGDRFGARWGLAGRVRWLFLMLFCEGLALMLFSQMSVLALAIPALILFSLCVQMAEGATYSVVPFINKRSLGSVAGIVGAGGNAGAVAAGFLFKGSLPWPTALFLLGAMVTAASFLSFAVTFSTEAETEAQWDHATAVDRRKQLELAGAAE